MNPTEAIAISVRDALRSANLLRGDAESMLQKAVCETILLWTAEKASAAPLRNQHNLLKSIWSLIREKDPAIGQIRARFKSLPNASRYYLRRRASRIWPRAFKFESNCDPFPFIARMGSRQLLRRLPRLLAEGAYIKDEIPTELEPTILGITRGLNEGSTGGRPRGDDELRLITYLAFDWLYATGELPKRGRNTDKGFGELVRYVFESISDLKPEQALRRYWEQVPKEIEDPK